MSTIREVPLHAVNGADLLPLAQIGRSHQAIAARNGIRFTQDLDDLDYYDISALMLDAAAGQDAGPRTRDAGDTTPGTPLTFALRAYRNAPPDTVDVLLPSELLGSGDLRGLVRSIVDGLGMEPSDVIWPEGFSATAETGADLNTPSSAHDSSMQDSPASAGALPFRETRMITFYYSLAPNPMKVALFLEEAGLPYDAKPVDTRKGEQFAPDFAALNPNNKVPVIVDGDATVFDSNAILLYLAEKTGKFLPGDTPKERGELLSWLMFVATGIGPYSGQAVHFRHFAPEPKEYAANRYAFEAKRHYGILDARLADRRYMMGDSYTIVDMAVWGWARMVPFVIGEDAWTAMPHLKRLLDEISARPAAIRATAIKDRHAFKTEFDEEARRHMFRHTAAA